MPVDTVTAAKSYSGLPGQTPQRLASSAVPWGCEGWVGPPCPPPQLGRAWWGLGAVPGVPRAGPCFATVTTQAASGPFHATGAAGSAAFPSLQQCARMLPRHQRLVPASARCPAATTIAQQPRACSPPAVSLGSMAGGWAAVWAAGGLQQGRHSCRCEFLFPKMLGKAMPTQ